MRTPPNHTSTHFQALWHNHWNSNHKCDSWSDTKKVYWKGKYFKFRRLVELTNFLQIIYFSCSFQFVKHFISRIADKSFLTIYFSIFEWNCQMLGILKCLIIISNSVALYDILRLNPIEIWKFTKIKINLRRCKEIEENLVKKLLKAVKSWFSIVIFVIFHPRARIS